MITSTTPLVECAAPERVMVAERSAMPVRVLDHRLLERGPAAHGPVLRAVDGDVMIDPGIVGEGGAFPRPLTSLVGRTEDVEAVSELMDDHRLVTLVGSGGCGKTRLALEVGRRLALTSAGGGVFVDLAPVDCGELVPSVVASALGVREAGTELLPKALASAVRERNLFMVVDNCERVVEACAPLIQHLLMACPNLVVLATSRIPLGVDGEQAWRVPSLSLPATGSCDPMGALAACDSGRLLLERAQITVAGLGVSRGAAEALVEICHKLDGIPLSLEMAATRVRALGAQEVNRGLRNRFALLASGSRMVPPRQRRLESSIDWSFGLLSEPEQVLFRRLAVFAGPFDVAHVEAVCSGDGLAETDVAATLAALVDQSVVNVHAPCTEWRYWLAETLRQYAHDRLVESGEERRCRDRYEALTARGSDAIALATGAESPAWRPVAGWESLTPAELRVAALVAEGLTNPEVGKQLFISRRTVQTHLSHIYAKLDVSNRAELAWLVARHRDV